MVSNLKAIADEGLAVPEALGVLFGNNKDWEVTYNSTDNRLEFIDPNGNVNYIDNGQAGDMLTSGSPHDSLSELGDDDHTQYYHTDGRRALTGAMDAGAFEITNAKRYKANHMPLQTSMLSGIITGGAVSRGSGTRELDIASGSGFVKDSTTGNSKKVDFSAQTVVVPSDSERILYIDNSGSAALSTSPPDLSESIVLATVITDGDSVIFLSEHHTEVSDINQRNHIYTGEVIGPIAIEGVLASQGGASGLSIDVTAGDFYIKDFRQSVAAESDITFTYWYRDGSGGWNRQENQTEVNPDKYDDGSGTLASVPAGDYKKDVLYVSGNEGDAEYHVFYAQSTQASQTEAEDSDLPTVNNKLSIFSLRSSGIVVQEGATNISSFIDERPFLGQLGPQTQNITEHGNLGGLSDDDHTQYLHKDGRRALTGDLDLGGNDLVDSTQTIWDTSVQEIPDSAMGSIANSTLVNSSVTITAGDGLKNGGSVSLGGSTTVDIEPADFAGAGLSDDGSDNAQVNAGEGIEIDGSDNVTSIFGQDHTNSHSETVQDTSGASTWTDYITLTPPSPSGTNDYRISWNILWYSASSQGARFRLRNKTDGTTVGEIQGVGNDGTTNNVTDEGVTHTWGSTNILTLSSSKDFSVQYIHKTGTSQQEIREANLEYWRVS